MHYIHDIFHCFSKRHSISTPAMTAAYVPTHHIRRHALTSSNCDRYVRSAKCMSTDRVIKCDYRPISIDQSIPSLTSLVILFRSVNGTTVWFLPTINLKVSKQNGHLCMCPMTPYRDGFLKEVNQPKFSTLPPCSLECTNSIDVQNEEVFFV